METDESEVIGETGDGTGAKMETETAYSITGPNGEYQVGQKLGGTDVFTLYKCTFPDGRTGILKIVTDVSFNGRLDREAYILGLITERAKRIERLAAEQKIGTGPLGYMESSAHLVDSFASEDQGGRQVIILEFSPAIPRWQDLTPLGHLNTRERVRVDLKTSVWILGRLLKLLAFTHQLGISTVVSGDNILIDRQNHHVLIFDRSESVVEDEDLSLSGAEAAEEVRAAVTEVIIALGGDPETGSIPLDDPNTDSDNEWYQRLLIDLLEDENIDADTAHKKFYALVRSVWPSKFHPFTAYPLD